MPQYEVVMLGSDNARFPDYYEVQENGVGIFQLTDSSDAEAVAQELQKLSDQVDALKSINDSDFEYAVGFSIKTDQGRDITVFHHFSDKHDAVMFQIRLRNIMLSIGRGDNSLSDEFVAEYDLSGELRSYTPLKFLVTYYEVPLTV